MTPFKSASRSASRGPYAKTEARRQQILDTAMEVFGERGFRGSSIAEIASRVGLSESGMLHHFGGKGALLEAVLEKRDDLDRSDASASGTGALQALRMVVRKNSQRKEVVRLFTMLSSEATDAGHPAHDYFVKRYERVRSELSGHFANSVRAGSIPLDIHSEITAHIVTALMDGLQAQWLLDDSIDMPAIFDEFIRRYFAGAANLTQPVDPTNRLTN